MRFSDLSETEKVVGRVTREVTRHHSAIVTDVLDSNEPILGLIDQIVQVARAHDPETSFNFASVKLSPDFVLVIISPKVEEFKAEVENLGFWKKAGRISFRHSKFANVRLEFSAHRGKRKRKHG